MEVITRHSFLLSPPPLFWVPLWNSSLHITYKYRPLSTNKTMEDVGQMTHISTYVCNENYGLFTHTHTLVCHVGFKWTFWHRSGNPCWWSLKFAFNQPFFIRSYEEEVISQICLRFAQFLLCMCVWKQRRLNQFRDLNGYLFGSGLGKTSFEMNSFMIYFEPETCGKKQDPNLV